jgi:GTP-binding protein EngB required for normal cell division
MTTAQVPRKDSFQYKLVLLGESGVGKSNLVLQFVKVTLATESALPQLLCKRLYYALEIWGVC